MVLDADGKYVHGSGKRVLVGENSFNKIVSNPLSEKNYSVYYNPTTFDLILRKETYQENDRELLDLGYTKYFSHNKGKLVENTYTENKFKELFANKALQFSKDKIYEKNFNDTIRIKSLLVNREYEAIVKGAKRMWSMELTTTGAGTYLKSLFNMEETPFPASKNIGFLKILITLFQKDDITILDFFSGSSTTADAVLRLNAEDGGHRKFIMVQLPEKTDEKSEAYKAGYKTICEIGKERIRRAGRKIKEENAGKDGIDKLDIGFRVLKLDSSNMQDVYYTPKEFTERDLFADNVKPDRTAEDLLFQVMLDLGVELSATIEQRTMDCKQVFFVNDNYLVACFDTELTEDTIKEIAKLKPYYFVMRDSSLASDNVADNFDQLFETYSKDTIRRII